MIKTLRHQDILLGGAQSRLTRAPLASSRPKSLHTHDFFELFWVQNGQIRHHLSERTETLSEGDLVFIAPGQSHGLQGKGENALIVLIALHPELVIGMANRHPSMQGRLFWADKGPVRARRDMKALAALNHAAVQLEQSNNDTLSTEAFLLPLCADLTAQSFAPEVPNWLADACLAARHPDVFRDGSAGLVARTGKAHPHVSRMMRRYLGITPSDFINKIRMDYASRALTTDIEPVSAIAADCGIPNMSHFHKLFRAAHGMTPLQYRQQFQRQILQPN
ncbi:helix-turn-helix transcriptional regulator [Yoonia litorea]|uniref:Transcriptional regulator, AraC family n=1 Tax=Yoonia litorea TaxID=1123755 RepID=A0A1I6N154_9RHOB|nr:AraC family transcriptional regulator [Yoonia litorea]SFS21518.1 transcriptional regulator, AraC family [Yoonia litorea]